MPLHRQHRPNGRLLRGGVDRNSCVMGWAVTRVSRLLRGGVDRNVGATLAAFIVARSPPARRRGSKPDRDCGVTTRQDVASCAEAWIETLSRIRSEEHTSELQSLMRISYAVFCLKKKN